jgi:hypothetical protein
LNQKGDTVEARQIDSESIVDVVFNLRWKSENAIHTDGYQASRINIWRDILPPVVMEKIMGKQAGERVECKFNSDDVLAAFESRNLFEIRSSQFGRRSGGGATSGPGVGRFYPRGLLKDVSGVYSANVQPFRCVGLNNGHMTVDFNHPLAGKELHLAAIVGKVESKVAERGGTSMDWMAELTTGPGMQTRWRSRQTDFFGPDALSRSDEAPDSLFYSKPRYVQHIDDTAIEMVKNTYARFLTNDMRVLDLMSSWTSHLPENLSFSRLAGLGLNEQELRRNPRLTEAVVQDLNVSPVLPFESNSFDAVVCTASVEYLVDPIAVFKEVARVLRPEGHFVVTFSNRWFPTKTIKIWTEIHEFERMGLVLEYFLRTESFKNLQTYSIRGLPRPHDDKYFPELRYSDPIYAVWGQKV